jgi:hypothetical protein
VCGLACMNLKMVPESNCAMARVADCSSCELAGSSAGTAALMADKAEAGDGSAVGAGAGTCTAADAEASGTAYSCEVVEAAETRRVAVAQEARAKNFIVWIKKKTTPFLIPLSGHEFIYFCFRFPCFIHAAPTKPATPEVAPAPSSRKINDPMTERARKVTMDDASDVKNDVTLQGTG